MKKIFIYSLILAFIFSCITNTRNVVFVMKWLNYPSASAVEYVNGKLYVMGDDATQMLVLDTNFNLIDSVNIFVYPEKRIPKNRKHDIESMLYLKDSNRLLLTGSGSLSPFRDSVWFIDLTNKQKKTVAITGFFNALKKSGIDELNIEGSVFIKDKVIFANRGHLGWPQNNLVYTKPGLMAEPVITSIIPVKHTSADSSFNGISGLAYADQNDALIMSVSTEATANTLEDGAIGKSYIWIIKNLHAKENYPELKPDTIIDLEEINPGFKGQKIESVTILNETKDYIRLVLVADNDDGSSKIYKLGIWII